jgi:hypothetical protein
MQAPFEIVFALMKCLVSDFLIKRMLTIFILFATFIPVHHASAQVWTKSSAPNKGWSAVAMSADGSILAAAINGSIYTSTNSGATWAVSGAPSKSWSALAISSDGKFFLACAPSGGIYTSTNLGTSWQSNSVPANPDWDAVAASANGSTLIAGAQAGPAYYSTNMGASWRSNGIPGGGYWTSVVTTADGTKLAAQWNGMIYTSTNSGATWTNYNNSGGTLLLCSTDGKQLLLPVGNNLYVSTNWGVTWTQTGTLTYGWPLAISSDAKRLEVLAYGAISVSTNLGASWTTIYAPVKTWTYVALSADGSKLVAVASGTDGIYLWQPPSLSFTNLGGNLVFSWSTNGTAFNLQMNADLTTTNWMTVTDLPTVINSQNQIIVSPTNSSGFFRLMSQ